VSTRREPIALSWSGGKDSALALSELKNDSRFEVVVLLTSVTSGYDRVSIHGVRRALLDAQAGSLGLPLIEITLEPNSSNEAYEAAFVDALEKMHARFPGIRRIAFGDLFLSDVRHYREQLLSKAGYDALFPLWGKDTKALASSFIESGFKAHLVCVDTSQLASSFAGRVFDNHLLADLPDHVDPCGENGEFHTFVSAGPIFTSPIETNVGETVLREERFAYCDLCQL